MAGSKYQMLIKSHNYVHDVEFKVRNISRKDIGQYLCHAENPLGSSHDDMTIYSKYFFILSTLFHCQNLTDQFFHNHA